MTRELYSIESSSVDPHVPWYKVLRVFSQECNGDRGIKKGPTNRLLLILAFMLCGICCQDSLSDDYNNEVQAQKKRPPTGAQPNAVCFISNHSGTRQLYSMNEDGSDKTQLTNDPSFQIWDAALSRDGKKVAVLSGVRGDSLCVMDIDGSKKHLVATRAGHPVWSPEGDSIAFTREVGPEAIGLYHIFIVNANGSRERELNPTSGSEFVDDWSRDRNALLAHWVDASYDSAHRQISWTKIVFEDLNGIHLKSWGPPGYDYFHAVFSRRARTFAFISNRDSAGWQDLWTIDASTDVETRITGDHHIYGNFQPVAWSETDDKILCNAERTGLGIRYYGSIVIIDISTKKLVDITPFNEDTTHSVAIGWQSLIVKTKDRH